MVAGIVGAVLDLSLIHILLMRFYDVDAGSITLNGHNVRDFDRSMLQKQLDGAMSQLDSTLLENLKSQSLLLVQLEYEAQGVAQDVQMGYLFRVGGQMLALTLLMVAVAVAVGFLASRVSAAIGRDLRRETFSSVIGFSNAEIENFSTASLITRTTNDIQPVSYTHLDVYKRQVLDGAAKAAAVSKPRRV